MTNDFNDYQMCLRFWGEIYILPSVIKTINCQSLLRVRQNLAEKFGLLENLLYICSQKDDDMDVAFILDKYFKGMENVSIDVFDSQTLNAVYRDVVKALTSHFEIEVSVLQALSYCLYEMMDNVYIHSGKPLGTSMTHYDDSQKMLRILIADDGKGIRASLAENERYKDVSEAEALRLCLQDSITDGKGMGFGLYTTSRLVDRIGKEFILHSGCHKLIIEDGTTTVIENGFWQGTLIYMEIGTGEEIDPSQIVDHRTDVAEQYNEFFVETVELESLW